MVIGIDFEIEAVCFSSFDTYMVSRIYKISDVYSIHNMDPTRELTYKTYIKEITNAFEEESKETLIKEESFSKVGYSISCNKEELMDVFNEMKEKINLAYFLEIEKVIIIK